MVAFSKIIFFLQNKMTRFELLVIINNRVFDRVFGKINSSLSFYIS